MAALLACDSDRSVNSDPPPPPVWSEITNLPSTITLYGLWAPRADLIFGVGSKGNIWQWDGQRWAQHANPSARDLFAIDGITGGSVVAVGDNGTVLEQSMGQFFLRDAGTSQDLRGVWRDPSGKFVAVGLSGIIVRGSGTTWSLDATPSSASLLSVWGASEGDVFAVGVSGTILHYDGVEWSTMPSGTSEILASVDGTSGSDVYAVGGGGTILHYNGSVWAPMTSGTTTLLQSVCADCGPSAVGANGMVLHRSNGTWERREIAGAPWLYATALAGDQQWAVGAHAVFRYNGTEWSSETRGTIPVLRTVTSSEDVGLVTAGENGLVLLEGPENWRIEDAGAVMRLNSVYISESGDILAAGLNRIFRYSPTGWIIENQDLVEFYDIGGNSERIFAVASDGKIRERIGDTGWKTTDPVRPELHAITIQEDGAFIAGANGLVYELQGDYWVELDTNFSSALWDIIPVGGETLRSIVVGEGGASYGFYIADQEWRSIPGAPSQTLYSLAQGPDDFIYAVGASGVALRFQDDKWNVIPVPTTRTFLRAWSRNGALFVAGGNAASGGMLFRFGPPGP